MKVIKGKIPLRIDLVGSWTDIPFFSDVFGGATLNAAIDIYVEGQLIKDETGIAVNYSLNFPVGSGLGTSGSLNALYAGLINYESFLSGYLSKMDIAEMAYNIERSLGAECGRQDQYGSAIGGINLFEFNVDKGVDDKNHYQSVTTDMDELSDLLCLIDTKISHSSSDIINVVQEKFVNGDKNTINAMFDLKNSAMTAQSALFHNSWEELGDIMNTQFDLMKLLSPLTSNETIENIVDIIQPSVYGMKPGGAGGGGCLIVLCKSKEDKEKLIADNLKFDRNIYLSQFNYYDVKIDTEGLCIWEENK